MKVSTDPDRFISNPYLKLIFDIYLDHSYTKSYLILEYLDPSTQYIWSWHVLKYLDLQDDLIWFDLLPLFLWKGSIG